MERKIKTALTVCIVLLLLSLAMNAVMMTKVTHTKVEYNKLSDTLEFVKNTKTQPQVDSVAVKQIDKK